MLLGLHSLLFQTKVKAAAASKTINFALFVSDWPPWMEVCRASLERKRPYTHG